MDRAAFLLLFSGVGLGWQPMPDGTNRYECVVQIEPEMLDELAQGKSIPVAGELPAHVQPIARIRVVVGSGEVPRQQLVTLMKPIDGSATPATGAAVVPDSSIKLAQFYGTTPAASSGAAEWNAAENRYGVPGSAPATAPAAAPVAAAPPAYQPAASNEANSWNINEATNAAAAQVGQSVENAAQPIRDGLNQMDDRVRSAFDRVGDSVKQTFDDLGRPLRGEPAAQPATNWNPPPATAAAGATLPAAAAGTGAAAAGMNWNQPEAPAAVAGSTPVQPGPRYGSPAASIPPWPTTPTDAGATAGQIVGSGAPSATADPVAAPAGAAAGDYNWNSTPDATAEAPPAAGGTIVSGSQPPPADDPWLRADPRFRSGGAAAAGPAQPGASSVSIPGAGAASGEVAVLPNVPWNAGPAAAPPPLGTPAIPAFGKDMLALPASRPLEGVDAAAPALGGLAASFPTAADAARPPSASRILDAPAQDWPARPAAAETKPATTAAERAAASPPPAARDNAALVIAAWVLLTGSIAGNLYLFWSYLDVRQKYRALVRKTARAVGSRFSAA